MPEGPATATGSSLTNMPTCVQTSVAPTISPASGNISATVTVTFTDPGGGRDANTGIWYTTDGSTPIPGSGSAQFNASGGTIAVTSPATVKAVAMWAPTLNPPATRRVMATCRARWSQLLIPLGRSTTSRRLETIRTAG